MDVEKISSEFVKLTVTTEGSDLGCERAFNRNITVGELKQRLELLTGASCTDMKLELRNKENPNDLLGKLVDDSKKLSQVPALENGLLLKVIDPNMGNIFDQTDSVEKLTISEERYGQVKNVRSFLQQNGLGRFSNMADETAIIPKEEPKNDLTGIEVGKRCEVRVKATPVRRGEIMYVGEICVKPGVTFVGVKLDEPLGKNNGSAGGKQYFECEPLYGVFVKPSDIEVGDFPELSLEDELDEM